MEIWKDIPEYEGIYQASNYGNIRTVEGKITYSKLHGKRVWKSRILKGRGDNPTTGKRVNLWKDGTPKDYLVARLVATTFLGTPPKGFTVNHKDGNRLNNKIDNLEWLSLEDNIRHGFATGLYPQKKVTLESDDSTLIFRSFAQASKFLGRNKGYISNCVKRKKHAVDSTGKAYTVSF